MTVKTWKGTWTSVMAYVPDDIVAKDGKFYTCIRKHTSGATFTTETADWSIYVPNIAEAQASTSASHIKTDNEFTTAFPSIISAIATAITAGLYSTTISLNEFDYYTVKQNLELKGYTVTTTRTGYGTTTATLKPVTISWVKYSIPTQFT
jgi:hypothetical protein